MTLSIVNHHASLPIAYRLYLPREWSDDAVRRRKAHVPASITFKTKPQIALEQIRSALKAGVAPGVVLMDASYGNNGKLRKLTGLGLGYVAAIMPSRLPALHCAPALRRSRSSRRPTPEDHAAGLQERLSLARQCPLEAAERD